MTPVNDFIGSPKTLHPSSPCPGPAQPGDRKISLLPFLPPLSLAFIKHLLHAKCRSRFFHASARHFTHSPRKPPQKSSIFCQLNAAPLSFFRFVSWRHRSLGPLASYPPQPCTQASANSGSAVGTRPALMFFWCPRCQVIVRTRAGWYRCTHPKL